MIQLSNIKNETSSKKEMLLGAIRLWALTQDMEEITDKNYIFGADKAFVKNNKCYAFLSEIDLSPEELKTKVDSLSYFYNYIYIATNDRKKKKYIESNAIKGVGIVCDSNPFGLGQLFEVLKEAKELQ